MIELSLAEIILVLCVMLLIIGPKDIPYIVSQLKKILLYIENIKNTIKRELVNLNCIDEKKRAVENTEQINYYLKKSGINNKIIDIINEKDVK